LMPHLPVVEQISWQDRRRSICEEIKIMKINTWRIWTQGLVLSTKNTQKNSLNSWQIFTLLKLFSNISNCEWWYKTVFEAFYRRAQTFKNSKLQTYRVLRSNLIFT
jgi:hypothetical protein